MKWNQVFGGILIGLGFGLFLGGAIVDLTQKWNSTSSAGFCMMLTMTGAVAIRSSLKGTAKEPASDAAGSGREDKTPPAR
jgi:hypothetical protein